MNIQVQESELGPFLANTYGDSYLYNVNRNTFKNEGAETLYRSHFGDSFARPNQFNLIIGTDSGLLLEYVLKKSLPKGSRYVFVELPVVIQCLKTLGKLDDLPEQVTVLCHDDLWEKKEEFQLQNYIYMDKVYYFEAFCTLNGYLPIYREQSFAIKVELENLIWHVGARIGKAPFLKRQFRDLCEFRNNITILKDRFQGKTAILLGGGPSLDMILPWLRENLDKIVILAVSRICKQLWDARIYPHFIFSVDPSEISYEVSKDMLRFWEHSIFISSNNVSPLLLGQWCGHSLFMGTLFPWKTPLNGEVAAVVGPTVTNAALQTAVLMGFSQVVFGGVDFCFDSKGYTHASGSVESGAGPSLGNTITVKTNDGRMAESIPDFVIGMRAMDEQVAYALQQGCRVINPAGQAARLENVEYIPLEQIQCEPPESDVNDDLFSLLPSDDSKRRSTHYQNVLKELSRVKKRLVKIRKQAEEALKCNDGLFGRKGMKADFKYKLRMDRIEKQLERDFSDLYTLVKQNGAHMFLRIVRVDSEHEWSDKEVERVGREYYQTCIDSVATLLDSIKDAAHRTEMRLEEEADSPDFERLIDYWQSEKHLGRIRLWKIKHPQQWLQLSNELRERLLAGDSEFEMSLHDSETVQLKKRKETLGLQGVPAGALKYFKTGDSDGLLRLQEGLVQHPDREKSEMLRLFVAGLQAELAGNPGQAMENYHLLIGDTANFLTEEVLLRVLIISLDGMELENARVAAECLSGLSVTYLPHYAKILHLTGEKAAALDVYADYLEKVGNDIPIMLKLGQLYLELDVIEGAVLMFNSVLEQDPKNQTALQFLSSLDEKKSTGRI